MGVLISIVVPCTDRVSGFEVCLKSILTQNIDAEIEVVVVENNSNDRAVIPQLINSIGDVRIKHFYLNECGNANIARNFGVRESIGAYVAFCDSDDRWSECHLSSKVECLNYNANAVAVYSGNYVDRGNRLNIKSSYEIGDNNPVDFFFGRKRGYAQTSSFVLCRSVFDLVQWDESLKRSQDYDFFIQVQKEFGWKFDVNVTSTVYWPRNEVRNVCLPSYMDFLKKHAELFDSVTYANYYFDRLMDSCMNNSESFQEVSSLIGPYRHELSIVKRIASKYRTIMRFVWLLNQNIK